MRGLENKICVVTGAGRGIGRAIALRLAEEGCTVVAANRDRDRGEAIVREIRGLGGTAEFVATDICDLGACAELVRTVQNNFGGIDVLVNNAAVGLLRSITETTVDEYAYIMDTNVRGAFFLCKAVLPEMVERQSGCIVNLASVASFVGFEKDAAYCTSKGAILMLTRQLALEYAPYGVRVNAVCPGFIETPELAHYVEQQADPVAAMEVCINLHPIGRIGSPEDVAGAVAFLLSDDAAFITGASLVVDGGMLTR